MLSNLSCTVFKKVEVYSLISNAKRHSPDFTPLPPGHRTCSFIIKPSQLDPGEHTARPCHFRRTELFNTQAFTVLPGTHLLLGRESARVSKVPCLGAQRRSIFSAAEDRTRDLSLVSRARCHWATTPHKFYFKLVFNFLASFYFNSCSLPIQRGAGCTTV